MGITGEADRKRRHFSALSPTEATTRKHPLVPLSEEKKLDAAVLQFQNLKLTQRLEIQKIEINTLADRLCQLNDKQQSQENTLTVVNNSWQELVDDLELRSNHMTDCVKCVRGLDCQIAKDNCDSPPEDAFLSRLLETGATESSSTSRTAIPTEVYRDADGESAGKIKNIMSNILVSLNDLNDLKNRLCAVSVKALSTNGQSQMVVSSDLQTEVKNLRIAVANLHLEHKSVAGNLQSHRDIDAKHKSDLKRLKGEIESTLAELEESNRSLAILKVERELTKGGSPHLLNRGNKQVSNDKPADKQRNLQDMESTMKELLDQSMSSLHELKHLHEYKLDILRHLSVLQPVKLCLAEQPKKCWGHLFISNISLSERSAGKGKGRCSSLSSSL